MNIKHGMTKTRPWRIWLKMRERCSDTKSKDWVNYGGRGISVCLEWQNSFAAFWSDMGPAYAPGLTIDRTDNDGNYTPNNCRWSTRSTQMRNNRRNVWLDTPKGRMLQTDAAKAFGMSDQMLQHRVRRSLDPAYIFHDGPMKPGPKRAAL